MKEKIKEPGVEYTPELKAELDSQYASYNNGKTKMISSSESKKRVGKILKTRKVKWALQMATGRKGFHFVGNLWIMLWNKHLL